MIDLTEFESISPYTDDQASEALGKLADYPAVAQASRYFFPEESPDFLKNVLKQINNKIFAKAVSLDVACYEDPRFYDKYQRATDVLAWSLFDAACSAVSTIIAAIIALKE